MWSLDNSVPVRFDNGGAPSAFGSKYLWLFPSIFAVVNYVVLRTWIKSGTFWTSDLLKWEIEVTEKNAEKHFVNVRQMLASIQLSIGFAAALIGVFGIEIAKGNLRAFPELVVYPVIVLAIVGPVIFFGFIANSISKKG
jgi:hypothetical protein